LVEIVGQKAVRCIRMLQAIRALEIRCIKQCNHKSPYTSKYIGFTIAYWIGGCSYHIGNRFIASKSNIGKSRGAITRANGNRASSAKTSR